MTPLHTEEHVGFTIEYHQDTDAGDPREEFGEDCGEADVRAWEAGEVFGFVILDDSKRHVDSCWGFYDWKHVQENAREEAEVWRAHLSERRVAAIRGAFALGSGAEGVL